MHAMGRTAALIVAAALLLLTACASGREPATADTAATTPRSEQSSPPHDLALVPLVAARGVTICIDVGPSLQEPNITVPVTVGSGPTTRTVMLTQAEIHRERATGSDANTNRTPAQASTAQNRYTCNVLTAPASRRQLAARSTRA